jgi:hypothetical protein
MPGPKGALIFAHQHNADERMFLEAISETPVTTDYTPSDGVMGLCLRCG